MQQTLFQCWNRTAKYPKEITQLIHSFLPNTEELFLEQRVRFLLESTNLDTNNWGVHNNYDTITSLPGTPPIVHMKIHGDVVLNCDLIKTCYFKKRYFKSMEVTRWSGQQMFVKRSFLAAVYNKPHTFGEFVNYLSAVIQSLNLEICQEMLDLMKSGNLTNYQSIPSLHPGARLFPFPRKFSHLRTIRHDNKQVFFPTPGIEVLHRIL